MFKKILVLATMLAFTNIYAYKIGDSLSEDTMKTLKIDNAKTTIVDFFASWCVSCKKELPLINQLHHKIDAKKVEIIGVGTDKDISKGKAFQKKLGLDFRVHDDQTQEVIKSFDPIGMPALYIIKDGKVVDVIFGAVHNVDEELEKLLKKY